MRASRRGAVEEISLSVFAANNCEHFCEWCLIGQHRSYEIEKYMALQARARHITQRLITALLSLAGGTYLRSSHFAATNPGSAIEGGPGTQSAVRGSH